MREALPYLLIVVLILLSAFFSGSEIAYASLPEHFVHRLEGEDASHRERRAAKLFRSYDRLLVAILVGNNLVNIGSSSVATVIAVGLMGEEGAWVATAVMTVLILTFGEILPKILATRFCRELAPALSGPLAFLKWLFTPIVWCVTKLMDRVSVLWRSQEDTGPAVTEDDLETILETVEDEGVVDEDTADLLQNALDFEDVLAWEIVTPRVDLFALDLEDPEEENRENALRTNHSRIPVYRESVDNIVGILHLDRYLRLLAEDPEAKLSSAVMPPRFVHKTMPISDVLRLMQKETVHMVVVTDEYGGTMGVVTMEDVLEQLVGEIWDEGDAVHEEFTELGENFYEADGDMRLEDFFDEVDVESDVPEEDDNATLGGWVIQMLGEWPAIGHGFTYKNLTITVRRVRKRRVLSVTVRVSPVEDEEE